MMISQRTRSFYTALVLVVALSTYVDAFLAPATSTSEAYRLNLSTQTDVENNNPMGLTPELLKLATAFETIGDDKLRYKQLLFMANQAPPMDEASMIPENKVPGCLSTVYVDGTAARKSRPDSDDDDEYLIDFCGDSDGLLTKGLVALLIRGLSGNTAADIQKVDPVFIEKAGISTSLTPGRNNGFLNMLAAMKRKALELEAQAKAQASSSTISAESKESSGDSSDSSDDDDDDDSRPMYNAIVTALQQLQPEKLSLKDVSHQHAGHVEGGGTESHFELDIVAEAFEGLNLVKRHQLVYMMLGEVMPKIHALQIQAKTPSEVA